MKFNVVYTPETVQRIEAGDYTAVDILALIWETVKKFRDKASVILWSSFVVLMLWGFHGDLAVLTSWFGTGWIEAVSFGLPWGEQLVSFVVGFLLVVVIPCLVVKFWFKEKLRDYGLGLPPKEHRSKAKVAFWAMLGVTMVLIVFAVFDPAMQKEYPLFVQRNAADEVTWTIEGWGEFIVYECVYLLFFITIEFAFRGYLLFGLEAVKFFPGKSAGSGGAVKRFGMYAILIQMLAYTTWHFGKPVPEMIGTVIWGICVAAIALRIRSIWPIILAHWIYNIFLDVLLWKGVHEKLADFF